MLYWGSSIEFVLKLIDEIFSNPKSMALIEFLTVAKKFDPEVYV